MSKLSRQPEGTPLAGSVVPTTIIEIVDEPIPTISVSAGGKFVIPIDDDPDRPYKDLDTKDRTPSVENAPKDGWIKINQPAIITVDLFRKDEDMDKTYYYVAGGLRSAVREDIKKYKVIPFWKEDDGSFYLWILSYQPKYPWFKSIARLFTQAEGWHDQHKVNVRAAEKGYRVKYLPDPTVIDWPTTPTAELLTEALGQGNIITSDAHPIYREMIAGYLLK